MESAMNWIMENYGLVLAGFMFLEKIVKITPFKWDDILVDMIISPVIRNFKEANTVKK